MAEQKQELVSFWLDNAIRLRWALRDIRAKRLKLSPVDPSDMRMLIEMGLVEMQNDVPIVTRAGLDNIETGG